MILLHRFVIIIVSTFIFFQLSYSQTVITKPIDSLKTNICDKNGFLLAKAKPVGKIKINAYGLASKQIYPSEIIKLEPNLKKIKYTQPKIYELPSVTEPYKIYGKDTIYSSEVDTIKYPNSINSLPPAYKEHAVYDIQYLDVDQGMPASYIRSVIEDDNGNFWFGTSGGGAVCYDGKSFTIFTMENGLSANHIYVIIKDSKGNIWMGTWLGGVMCYDGKTITRYNTNQGLGNNTVLAIYEDSKQNIWIGTYGGGVHKLEFIDNKTKVTSFTTDNGLPDNRVVAICEDYEGTMWFGTDGGGACSFNGEFFIHYNKENGLVGNHVYNLYRDSNNVMWIGTWGSGLSILKNNVFINYNQSSGLLSNVARVFYEYEKDHILLGTYGGGVNHIKLTDSNYYSLSVNKITTDEGLSNDRILSIYEDKTGKIWFGTDGGGVNRFDRTSFINLSEKQGLPEHRIWRTFEDSNGNLWFCTDNGICRFENKKFYIYDESNGLADNKVWDVCEDSIGNLWFSTQRGISKLSFDDNYTNAKFTNYNKTNGLPGDNVWQIIEDRNKNIWISFYDGGVCRLNPETNTITTINRSTGLVLNETRTIYEDNEGNIWVGTNKGLSKISINENNYNITNYTTKNGLLNDNINFIYQDHHQNLWFGTSGGGLSLLKHESQKDVFYNYTKKNGLPHDIVLSMTQDSLNRYWLGTEGGIVLFTFDNDFNILRTFNKQDGLQSLDAVFQSIYRDSKNQIWCGMGEALTMLDLNKFKLNNNAPVVQLKKLKINEQFIDFRNLESDSILYNNNIDINDIKYSNVTDYYNYPNNLELPYNMNHLTFQFSATEWDNPDKVQIQYKLEGLDTDWNKLTNENKAEYRNLSHGKYVLKIKAIGAENIWSETFEYKFLIHPPWWFSWWAYIVYSILFIIFIFIIVRLNIRLLVKQKQELEKIVKARTENIIQAKEEIELQKVNIEEYAAELKATNEKLIELDEFKQGLTNMIVHDLKNPLNSMINLPEIITENHIRNIKQSSKQMINLVLNILDVNKYENTKIQLEQDNYSLNQIINEALEQVLFLAEQKNIQINIDIKSDEVLYVDNDIIIRVFVNILNNAIKYTNNNGNVCIKGVYKQESDKFFCIEISDTGLGIAKKYLNSVFDKFKQISAQKSGKIRSTGIGLTFCKMAIEAHGGVIIAESDIDKGTTFKFTLPVGNKDNIEVNTLQKDKNEEETQLTNSDKEILNPYALQLSEINVYEYTKVKQIIDKIDANTKGIDEWKNELMNALFVSNEKQYTELINTVLK